MNAVDAPDPTTRRTAIHWHIIVVTRVTWLKSSRMMDIYLTPRPEMPSTQARWKRAQGRLSVPAGVFVTVRSQCRLMRPKRSVGQFDWSFSFIRVRFSRPKYTVTIFCTAYFHRHSHYSLRGRDFEYTGTRFPDSFLFTRLPSVDWFSLLPIYTPVVAPTRWVQNNFICRLETSLR